MNEKGQKAQAPPYVAFRTLWNFLDRLGEVGTPPRIDRSVWGDNLSGAYGSQLMAALRFLKLVDEGNNAYGDLKLIAEDREMRRSFLQNRLLEVYGPALSGLDLSQATMAQLEERFRDHYSVAGATFTKAIAFFIHAAQTTGIALSPYIERSVRKRTVTGKPKRKVRPPKTPISRGSTPPSVPPPPPPQGDAQERIVTLRSGGTVHISLSVNPFKLSAQDRQFVFELIDLIQHYESSESGGDD